MLTVVHDNEGFNENAAGTSLLDEIVRDGARAMLAGVLQAEVAAYVDAHRGEGGRGWPSAGGPERPPRKLGR